MSKWTPYHKESAEKAKELCKGVQSPYDKYDIITAWVTHNFVYDYIREIKILQTNKGLPDIPRTWELHMGVCMDVSAMVVNMLKAVGVRAYFCIGSADENRRHAWVEAWIGKDRLRYDHSNPNDDKIKEYVVRSRYS